MKLFKLKKQNDNIIKIWQDSESQDTLIFMNLRSGLWHMPIGSDCKKGKMMYSYWLADLVKIEEYGLNDKKKNKTIYRLCDIKSK